MPKMEYMPEWDICDMPEWDICDMPKMEYLPMFTIWSK